LHPTLRFYVNEFRRSQRRLKEDDSGKSVSIVAAMANPLEFLQENDVNVTGVGVHGSCTATRWYRVEDFSVLSH
jgi:hypothetical protein